MIWLTWRQFRAQTVAASAALAMILIVLAATTPHLAHLYDTSGIATCQAHGDCVALATSFVNKLAGLDAILYFLGIGLLFAAPLIIGLFWGAPLIARELETGTLRLAWNQSVTRTRWLAVKLGLIGLASMATAGLLSLMLTWWSSPIDRAVGLKGNNSISFIRIGPVLFAVRGITPIAYAALAFVLGVTAGVLIRRTVPAMAATLAGFAFIQIAWPSWIGLHLLAPAHAIVTLTSADMSSLGVGPNNSLIVSGPASPSIAGGWIMSTQTIDQAGHVLSNTAVPACQGSNFQTCQAGLGALHLRDVISYQPASRYWAFQWYETAVFLALAVALAGFCFWWIGRRRLS
jgi:hypothetical protein